MPPYSTPVRAVNNHAPTLSDRSGGISRRRVIFNFSRVIPENERDLLKTAKTEAELPVIIRYLLTHFADQKAAREQLSDGALVIKREYGSLVDFCSDRKASSQHDGMSIGDEKLFRSVRDAIFIMPIWLTCGRTG